jgi:hypothetical protein
MDSIEQFSSLLFLKRLDNADKYRKWLHLRASSFPLLKHNIFSTAPVNPDKEEISGNSGGM